MFEDISNPLKGKGKEKDVGKRRAYVRVVTNLGGASLNLELYCEKVSHTSHLRCCSFNSHLFTGAQNLLQFFNARQNG